MGETRKMVHLCRVFDKAAAREEWNNPNELWLWVGAFINVWALISCSVCMLFCFILAGSDKGPKDIIFDSLGLTFLYNLDDIASDLDFLDEKWDEDMMGDIYGGLADAPGIMNEIA